MQCCGGPGWGWGDLCFTLSGPRRNSSRSATQEVAWQLAGRCYGSLCWPCSPGGHPVCCTESVWLLLYRVQVKCSKWNTLFSCGLNQSCFNNLKPNNSLFMFTLPLIVYITYTSTVTANSWYMSDWGNKALAVLHCFKVLLLYWHIIINIYYMFPLILRQHLLPMNGFHWFPICWYMYNDHLLPPEFVAEHPHLRITASFVRWK